MAGTPDALALVTQVPMANFVHPASATACANAQICTQGTKKKVILQLETATDSDWRADFEITTHVLPGYAGETRRVIGSPDPILNCEVVRSGLSSKLFSGNRSKDFNAVVYAICCGVPRDIHNMLIQYVGI